VKAPRSDFDREMQTLEAELKRLEAEYNQFFAGRLPRLPWESRKRVETLVRRYDRTPMQNTAERFRFQSLQARFSAFAELWDRTLKAKEEGRLTGTRPSRRTAAPPAAATAPAGPPPAPEPTPAAAAPAAEQAATAKAPSDRLVAEARVGNPSTDAAQIKQLYERLSEARKAAGEKPVPFARFEKLVSTQVAKLGAEGGAVAFRVTVKDGKVNLTAKSTKEKTEER
jgi:hypothetical protein